MGTSSSKTDSPTKILDLPDFCLQKIFANLDQTDLVAVAEVCNRFRTNAQAHSSKFKHVNFYGTGYVERMRSRLSMLRYFGASIETINLSNSHKMINRQRLIVKHLHRYCNETLIQMMLCAFNTVAFDDGLIFRRIQKLKMINCQMDERFLNLLPLTFPALRELQLISVDLDSFAGLHQKFENLESICFESMPTLLDSDIHTMLKHSSQLKRIQLMRCEQLSDSILLSFASFTSQLEHIWLSEIRISDGFSEYVGHLRQLKSLRLGSMAGAVLLINEIVKHKIPIKNLHLISISDADNTDQLIDGISKCKTLKLLELSDNRWLNLKPSHIRTISQQLGELTELQLYDNRLALCTSELLDLIRNMDKLQLLRYDETNYDQRSNAHSIDASIYREMVNIVEMREKRTHLKIISNSCPFVVEVPDELAIKHKKTVELVLHNYR